MKFPQPVTIAFIADLIDARIIGDGNARVAGINEIHRVENGDLVFVDHPKYYQACIESPASVIIINQEVPDSGGKALLVTDNPFGAYLRIVDHFRPFRPQEKMISDSARIAKTTVIMPGVFIGEEVTIGENCVIHPHVTILGHCKLGDHIVIQSGTVIGSDAFYYNKKTNRDQHYTRMKSCGTVIIEDHVEIGAGCMIDRGVTHETRIGRGTKMDNLIHVGHDTVIGKNCLIAAAVTIAGGVIIEDEVTIWGSVVINKTLTVGTKAVLLGKTGVTSSIEGGKTYWGTPAQEAGAKKRELVWIKRIPELWESLKKIKPGGDR